MDLAKLFEDPLFWASHYAWCASDRRRRAAFPDVEAGSTLDRTPVWEQLFGAATIRERARSDLALLAAAGGDLELAVQRKLEGDPFDGLLPGYRDSVCKQLATASQRADLPDVEIRLWFPSGWCVLIAYGEGPSIAYSLANPAGREPVVLLGEDGPSGSMPFLRWAEVELLARTVERIEPVAHPVGATSMLAGRLLATCAWTTARDKAAEIERLVRGFWEDDPAARDPIARACARRVRGITWVEHEMRGWICTGPKSMHSRRRWPENAVPPLGTGYTAEHCDLLRQFFVALDHVSAHDRS